NGIVILLVLYFAGWLIYIVREENLGAVFLYVLVMLGAIIFYHALRLRGEKFTLTNLTLFWLTFWLFVSIVFLYLVTVAEVRQVVKGAKYYGVKIEYKSGLSFISDSSSYYIGNTKTYLFIHDEKRK